jgi:hypothetical protein
LLNGRNKKVSNEVFDKIHDAYPNLSILWLLFGEGDMWVDGNIEFSEAQNGQNSEGESSVDIDNEGLDFGEDLFKNVAEFSQDRNLRENPSSKGLNLENQAPIRQSSGVEMSVSMDKSRRVVNIMVFYSDNSFETFVPKP